MWLDSHMSFLAVRLWTKELVAPEYSPCSCSLADSLFLSLEDPRCGFHFERYCLRVDFTPSGEHLAAEGAAAGGAVAWHMAHGLCKVPVLAAAEFLFPCSDRTCHSAPLTSTSLLQA